MEVDITYGSITVRLGGVASYCDHGDGATVQPDNPSGVTVISYTYAVAGTGYQTTNPTGQIRTDIGGDPRILSTVAPGTVIPATHSLVCLFQRATRPPGWISGRSSYIDEALPIVVVSYGPLSTAMAPQLIRPPAIGHPSNATIAALRSTLLVFDNATIGALPAVIDIDALPIQPSPGWGGFFNERPNIDDYIAQFAGFCGELWTGWATEGYTPFLQHKGYGGFFSAWVSYALLLLVSTDNAAKRRQLAQRLTQWGVDLLGSFIHGRQDYVDGGHMQGRKALVVLSGHLLQAPWQDATAFLASIGSAGEFNEDLQFFTRSSPPAWVWGWPHGYIGKSGLTGTFRVNIDEPINTWNERVGYYLSQYFKQEVCGTQIGCAVAMRILGLTNEMGAGHRGMMEQWMEGPSPTDQAAMTAHDARLADIGWGSGYAADTGTYDFGRAAWEVYGDYEPPATTVERDPGPGTSAYASTRYTASVDAGDCYVWSHTRTTIIQTDVASPGDLIEACFAKFGASGPTTVSIGLVSGTVTSVAVYPEGVVSAIVSGGVAILSDVPVGAQLRVVINNDRRNPMHVFAQPLKPALPVSRTDWTSIPARSIASIDTSTNVITMTAEHGWSAGQQVIMATSGTLPAADGETVTVHTPLYVIAPSATTLQLARSPGGAAIDWDGPGSGTHTIKAVGWTNAASAIYFPAGVHVIGRSFPIASGVTVYAERGAMVIGSWRLVGTDNALVTGPGVLGGMFATAEDVAAISDFATKIGYSMFLGFDGAKFDFANDVEFVTILGQPFYCSYLGVNTWTDVAILCPWYWENNGPDFCVRDWGVDHTSRATRVFAWTGDDTFTAGESVTYCELTIDRCFAVTMANSCFHLGYWSQPPTGFDALVQNSHAMHLGIVDTGADVTFPVRGGNTIFKAWTDGFDGQEAYGRFLVAIEGLDVWGPIRSRVFHLGNRVYPFGVFARQRKGQLSNWTISGLRVHETPGQISIIESLDATNTPHDIAVTASTVAGAPLTAGNWATFVQTSPDAYNITVDGVRVDMIRTTGAASVAVGASGTGGLQLVSVGSASVSISAAGAAALQVGAVGAATIPIAASGFSTLGVVPPPVPDVPTNVARGPGARPSMRLRRRGWWTWLSPW